MILLIRDNTWTDNKDTLIEILYLDKGFFQAFNRFNLKLRSGFISRSVWFRSFGYCFYEVYSPKSRYFDKSNPVRKLINVFSWKVP